MARGRTRPAPRTLSSSVRSAASVPPASASGSRSSATWEGGSGAVAAIGLEQRHAGGDIDLDERGAARRQAAVERLAQLVARADPGHVDPVALRDLGGLELGQVEAGRSADLLELGEPLEDPVLVVAQDEERDR